MSKHWQAFWDNYRSVEARSEDDLFVQVGKTIARQPIPRPMFITMLERIVERLELGPSDHLLDMCCGNGLVSFELARGVGQVTAVDFAQHLIDTAVKFKALPNIDYVVGDVTAPIEQLCARTSGANGSSASLPSKFLMNDALAYFEPHTLAAILDNVQHTLEAKPFRFLLTGIPNDALKWSFYDTPERKLRHLENIRLGNTANDGLGRWWHVQEIETVCVQRRLQVLVSNQPQDISNYRMDALIWRA